MDRLSDMHYITRVQVFYCFEIAIQTSEVFVYNSIICYLGEDKFFCLFFLAFLNKFYILRLPIISVHNATTFT